MLTAIWNLWAKRRVGTGLPLLRQLVEENMTAGWVVVSETPSLSDAEIKSRCLPSPRYFLTNSNG